MDIKNPNLYYTMNMAPTLSHTKWKETGVQFEKIKLNNFTTKF